MKTFKRFALSLTAVVGLATALPASADLLFDRGLPTINLNNDADANRSNVSWVSGDLEGFTGDTFKIGVLGQKYVINSLTVWGAQIDPLSADLSKIELYLGKSGSALSLLSSGNVVGTNGNSNTNITHSPGFYPTTATEYESTVSTPSNPIFFSVMQTTFSGLNLVIDGGVLYDFGVWGDSVGWYSHASNAALSDNPDEGADGLFGEFLRDGFGSATSLNSAINSSTDNVFAWDKSSDINVQIDGNLIPEPASLALVGLALLGLGYSRRKLG